MRTRSLVFTIGTFGVLWIYLFVTAPPPLPGEERPPDLVPVEVLFEMLALENDAVRGLYTQEIVGPGQAVDLGFDEKWRNDDVQAGPLPALFLRGVASHLERNPIPVSLFLGSDFPIEDANAFAGAQVEAFQRVRQSRAPVYFFDESTGRNTAMFADLAVADPCVTCHNEHANSPKTDWEIGDVMGATTWQYPQAEVPLTEVLAAVEAYREGARSVYESYLEVAQDFDAPPEIGDCWPKERRCLPTADLFMKRATDLAAPQSMAVLLEARDRVIDAAP